MDPSNPDRDKWLLAIKDDIDSLRAHGTWVLTPLPPKQRVLSGTWVFTMKMGLTGLVDRYKNSVCCEGIFAKTWD